MLSPYYSTALLGTYNISQVRSGPYHLASFDTREQKATSFKYLPQKAKVLATVLDSVVTIRQNSRMVALPSSLASRTEGLSTKCQYKISCARTPLSFTLTLYPHP